MSPLEYNFDSIIKRTVWRICLKPVPGNQIVESVKIKTIPNPPPPPPKKKLKELGGGLDPPKNPAEEVVGKNNSASSKSPIPFPHNFTNGPSLIEANCR